MKTLETPLCHLLGIKLPIVQAPIGSATCPALAAAVSETGGLGMLSVTWRNLEQTRQTIRDTFAITGRPFGVNVVLQWPQEERLKACLDEGVKIVSLFWGDPTPYVPMIHAASALVLHTVGSAAEAKRVTDAGVDVVVAQGWESGGHVCGDVATLPLIPRVVDAVTKPVIAAGGIADGRGIAAALVLGASGVWLGTRFLVSEEAAVPLEYKEKLLQATETDTVYSSLFDKEWPKAPHRTLRNSTVRAWEEAGRPSEPNRPGEHEIVANYSDGRPVERYSIKPPLLGVIGNLEAMAMYSGQGVGLISQVKPAKEIIRKLVDETIEALDAGQQWRKTFANQS